MTDIATALNELGVTEWVLRGEPTSEAEFNDMFRKVTGADSNGSAIESDNPDDNDFQEWITTAKPCPKCGKCVCPWQQVCMVFWGGCFPWPALHYIQTVPTVHRPHPARMCCTTKNLGLHGTRR